MRKYEDILAKAKQYREDFPDDWDKFVAQHKKYYEGTVDEDILCDFYMWICRRDG